jgi:hypothetical protein
VKVARAAAALAFAQVIVRYHAMDDVPVPNKLAFKVVRNFYKFNRIYEK